MKQCTVSMIKSRTTNEKFVVVFEKQRPILGVESRSDGFWLDGKAESTANPE